MTLGLVKRIVAVSLMAGSVFLLAIGLRGESGNLAKRDFIAYWSAGQLLAQHGNPYSDTEVIELEKQQGFKEATASTMLNPPWAMIFVLPLGFVSAYVGALVWILAIVVCIMMSVRLLRTINRGEGSQDHLLAYAFAPILACIMGGQMSGFTCLAISLFLYWRSARPFAAGMAAAVLTIKPHLFALFFLVLLMDSLRKREFRTLVGVAGGFLVGVLVPLAFNHELLSQYLVRNRLVQIGDAFIPTISFVLRLVFNRQAFWIQFLPFCAAVMWAVWYYMRNREIWDWNRQGLRLLVVSIWVAPYSTFLDELVLLPVVVAGIYFTNQRGTPNRGTLAIFLAVNAIAFALLLAQTPVMSGAYVWSTTAWVLWYLYAVHDKASVPVKSMTTGQVI